VSVKPVGDRIVCRAKGMPEQTESGLYLPFGDAERPQEGVVVAIGPGAVNDEGKWSPAPQVQVGDTVLFAMWGGTEIRHEGEELVILQARDVLAVVGGER
jgi:chaperonin GroES